MSVPKALEEICGRVKHPAVTLTGVTLTADGRWALLAQVRLGTPTPLREVERLAGDFPAVYEEEEDALQVARPAYPAAGE